MDAVHVEQDEPRKLAMVLLEKRARELRETWWAWAN
jgi:hypothetical protein